MDKCDTLEPVGLPTLLFTIDGIVHLAGPPRPLSRKTKTFDMEGMLV